MGFIDKYFIHHPGLNYENCEKYLNSDVITDPGMKDALITYGADMYYQGWRNMLVIAIVSKVVTAIVVKKIKNK